MNMDMKQQDMGVNKTPHFGNLGWKCISLEPVQKIARKMTVTHLPGFKLDSLNAIVSSLILC